MPNKTNLIGCVFGKLTVIKAAPAINKRTRWICKCECGNIHNAGAADLTRGHTKSCGCFKVEYGENAIKHGNTRRGLKTSEYSTWTNIKSRCYNKNVRSYKDYGERGIKVCDRWLHSFDNFLTDMGKKPSLSHSIERRDSNGDYEPNNCYWGTDEQQRLNKRNNRWLEYKGKTLLMERWAEIFDVYPSTIYEHLTKRNKSFHDLAKYYEEKKGIIL